MTKDIKFYFQIKNGPKCDKFQINITNLMGLRFLKRDCKWFLENMGTNFRSYGAFYDVQSKYKKREIDGK